jgi:hypothetical protein
MDCDIIPFMTGRQLQVYGRSKHRQLLRRQDIEYIERRVCHPLFPLSKKQKEFLLVRGYLNYYGIEIEIS